MDDRAVPRLSPTVLLVDDETAIRSLLARRLQASGYGVISAASGREALEILTQEVVTVDLLLTDVMMPGLDRAAAGRDRAVPLALGAPTGHDRGCHGHGAEAHGRVEHAVPPEAVHGRRAA